MKIAICGKMCSGKSTLANHIMRTFPGYQKYSFARRVKELCVDLFDMQGKDRELLITFANSKDVVAANTLKLSVVYAPFVTVSALPVKGPENPVAVNKPVLAL